MLPVQWKLKVENKHLSKQTLYSFWVIHMPEGDLAQEDNKMDNKYQRIYSLEVENCAKHTGSLEVGMGMVHFSTLGGKHWLLSAKSASVLVSWRFFPCSWRLSRSGSYAERDVLASLQVWKPKRNRLEMLKCWCENLASLGERTGKLCQLGQQNIVI